jgi:diketogulonate reductase-like aldo/keto reductase
MAIPKSSQALHLQRNWQAAALRLSPEELAELDRLFAPPRRRQPLAVG